MKSMALFLLIFFSISMAVHPGDSEEIKKEEKAFKFRIGMGLTFPTGKWADYFTIGLGANTGLGYSIIQRRALSFELLGDLGANIFFRESHFSESSWYRIVIASDGRLNIKSVKPVTFFLQGGIGVYWDIVEIYDYQLYLYEKESDLGFGPRIGLGFAYKFVELKFVYHMEKNQMFSFVLSVIGS